MFSCTGYIQEFAISKDRSIETFFFFFLELLVFQIKKLVHINYTKRQELQRKIQKGLESHS
jgi:hypothetical protein